MKRVYGSGLIRKSRFHSGPTRHSTRQVSLVGVGMALVSAMFVFLFLNCGGDSRNAKLKVIGVTQLVSHPAIDRVQEGFRDALAEAGYTEGQNIKFEMYNAQGEMASVIGIAQNLRQSAPDLVHAIGTNVSQAVAHEVRETPVVFSAVTDPVAAGIVPAGSQPDTATGTNLTGVSDRWPIHKQFELYAGLVPDARVWGTIYNPADTNSLVHIGDMRESAAKLGLELVEVTISSSAEAITAAQHLAGQVQAFNITSDNTVTSALEAVVQVCVKRQIPLFVGDPLSVERGAVLAYGLDYYLVGRAAGQKAARILGGELPGAIPWGPADSYLLVINEMAAAEQGVALPADLRVKADRIIRKDKPGVADFM